MPRSFLRQVTSRFFLSVNYPDAHRPFIKQVKGLPENPLTGKDVKPLAYFGLDAPQLRENTADYYNCMSRLDSKIGDLLDALKKSGKAENTLVVYIGDHGADMLRGKRTSYEGGVRIPMIIQWPGELQPEQVRNELVSTLDLMPTLSPGSQRNVRSQTAGAITGCRCFGTNKRIGERTCLPSFIFTQRTTITLSAPFAMSDSN